MEDRFPFGYRLAGERERCLKPEYSRPDIEQALASARSVDELEAALTQVRALQFTVTDPDLYGHRLFTSKLDAILADLPRKLRLADLPLAKGNANPCIVASEFFAVGGHSRVAQDIAALLGDSPPTVVLTDVLNRLKHGGQFAEIGNPGGWNRRAQLVLGAQRLIDKVVELYNLMAALRPSRIFLLTHHMDPVAPIALWPFRDVVEFIHHGDHVPALGATMGFGAHVDVSWRCHRYCQARGLDPIFAGVQALIPPAAPERATPRDPHRIRLATCGSPVKFTGPARYRWVDYAAAALSDPRAEFIHIGPVTDELSQQVSDGLTAAGIDPARYRFIGSVAEIGPALAAHEVDVYVGSYPTTGLKANLEVMAAGYLPVLPLDPDLPDLLRFDLPNSELIEIDAPAELLHAIEHVLDVSSVEAMAARSQLIALNERFERYALGTLEP
jgi:hypothetical protein